MLGILETEGENREMSGRSETVEENREMSVSSVTEVKNREMSTEGKTELLGDSQRNTQMRYTFYNTFKNPTSRNGLHYI